MKLYKRLFTVTEIKENFGYDLMTIANQGGFVTQEFACEAWCDEAALSIHNLIVKNRGVRFINALYDAIEKDEELFNALKMAQMYEMLFIVENGNIQLLAKQEQGYIQHSNDALDLLYSYGILILGM